MPAENLPRETNVNGCRHRGRIIIINFGGDPDPEIILRTFLFSPVESK